MSKRIFSPSCIFIVSPLIFMHVTLNHYSFSILHLTQFYFIASRDLNLSHFLQTEHHEANPANMYLTLILQSFDTSFACLLWKDTSFIDGLVHAASLSRSEMVSFLTQREFCSLQHLQMLFHANIWDGGVGTKKYL